MNDRIKEIQKDVDEMTKSMDTLEGGSTDAPGTEAPGTEAPGTEAPGTESPSTEAPSTEAPSTEAPSTEAPETEAPSTEAPSDLETQNKLLRAQIEELSGGRKAPKTEAPGTSAPSTDAPVMELDFLGDRDPEEIIRDPKEFNKLLNDVYAKGLTNSKGVALTREEVATTVRDNMTIVAELKKTSDEFFDSNKDLKPFRKVVAVVFEDLAAANPKKNYAEIVTGVAKETRKRLALPEPKAQPKKETKKPKLPRKKSSQSRGPAPKPDEFDSELDEMDKALNK